LAPTEEAIHDEPVSSRRRRRAAVAAAIALVAALLAALVWWLGSVEPSAAVKTLQGPVAIRGNANGPTERASTEPTLAVRSQPLGPDARGELIRRVDGGVPDAESGAREPSASALRTGSSSSTGSTGDVILAVASDQTGTLTGKVTTARVPPKLPAPSMTSDPVCTRPGPSKSPLDSIDDGGNVGAAFVWIQTERDFPPPSTPAAVNQLGCEYVPHVIGAIRGQQISIVNADGTLHNVHGYLGIRTVFNQAEPPRSPALLEQVASRNVGDMALKLKCDVHPWMIGWVYFANNPSFAVTNASGEYRIDGVPIGRYTLQVRHETLGILRAVVEVAPGQTTVADFRFPADP
jgi:hypothetical protein